MLRHILSFLYYFCANGIAKFFRFAHRKMSYYYSQKPCSANSTLNYQPLVYDVINKLLIDPNTRRVKKELTEERACPNCNSVTKELLFQAPDGFDYVICKDCGFIYSNPILKPKVELRLIEKIDTVTQILIENRTNEYQYELRTRFNRYLKDIHKYKKSGRLLDVGTLTGNFLLAAQSFGYDCYGIEKFSRRVEIAKNRGLNVQLANIEEIQFYNKFDIITCWETLEHINSPKKALINIRNCLTPNGIFSLSVPNFRCPTVLILKDYCSWLQIAQDHRNMFTPLSLMHMLSDVGFDILEINTEGRNDWVDILHYLFMEYGELRIFKNRYKENRTKNIKRIYGKLLSAILYPLERAAGMGTLIRCIARKRK